MQRCFNNLHFYFYNSNFDGINDYEIIKLFIFLFLSFFLLPKPSGFSETLQSDCLCMIKERKVMPNILMLVTISSKFILRRETFEFQFKIFLKLFFSLIAITFVCWVLLILRIPIIR